MKKNEFQKAVLDYLAYLVKCQECVMEAQSITPPPDKPNDPEPDN